MTSEIFEDLFRQAVEILGRGLIDRKILLIE